MKNPEKQIIKIVVTGGPCAGKTTGMHRIRETFTQQGYGVILVGETATELISGGVAPWTLESCYDYQLCQMQLQIEKEKVILQAAEKLLHFDKVLIVFDRGLLDNKAYMPEEEFQTALSALRLCADTVTTGYDAVFHLVTAGNGAEESYTLCNNQARTETVEEAIALDEKLMAAWEKHPYLRVIGAQQCFEEKMQQLLTEIADFLKTVQK